VNYTHQTAPTQFIEANGMRFAYRRFGSRASDAFRRDLRVCAFDHNVRSAHGKNITKNLFAGAAKCASTARVCVRRLRA